MKKNILISFLIITFVFFSHINISASNGTTLSIPSFDGYRGDIVEITVNISSFSNMQACGFNIEYDKSVLEVVSAVKGNIINTTPIINTNKLGKIIFSYAATSPLTNSGSLLNIQFRIKNNASYGTSPISISLTEITDGNFNSIDTMCYDGCINVVAPKLEAPSHIEVLSLTDSTASIFWDGNDEATAYNLYLNGALYNSKPLNENICELTNLNFNTEYQVQVTSMNYTTESDKSSVLSFYTKNKTLQVMFVDWNYNPFGNNEGVLSYEEVEYGLDAIAPETPIREGYRFISWDKDFTNVTENLIIQAQYEPIVCKVSFVDWDGTILSEQTINYGESAIAPENPTREGYIFDGWDYSYENITFDTTITALYREITCTHGNTIIQNKKDATCIEKGYSGDTYCTDCKTVLESGKVLDYAEHNYKSVITEPTPEAQGYTTHTCTVCGDSYVDNYTDYVNPVIASGSCGTTANWELLTDGTLKITGNGATKNYGTQQSVPWYSYASQITKVIIDETITKIGHYSFYCINNLESVTTDNADLSFGYYVFSGKTTFYAKGAGTLEEFVKTEGHTLVKPENPETVLNPELVEATMDSITLKALIGYEYSMDGFIWQDSNVFTNLFADTEYVFYQRIKEGVYKVSNTSAEARFSTLGQIEKPTIEKINGNTVTLVLKYGYEYSVDGKVWQSSNVFINLDFDKILTFYQRIAGDTENISEATECLIPSAPVIQLVGATKVVVKAIDGYEYSLDGEYWQSSNVFTMLVPEFEYVVYQRYAGSDVYTVTSAETAFITNGQDEVDTAPDSSNLVTLCKALLNDFNDMSLDYNADGEIDVRDLVRLKKYLAGINVPLGSQNTETQTVELLSQPAYLEQKNTVA